MAAMITEFERTYNCEAEKEKNVIGKKIAEARKLKKISIPAYEQVAWGNCLIYTNTAFIAEANPPKPRLQQVPFLIQRTCLKIPHGCAVIHNIEDGMSQKELEKKLKLDYKNNKPFVLIQFNEQKERK